MRRASALILIGALIASGCSVQTNVTVKVDTNQHGTVAVTVAMDKQALTAIGGASAIETKDLQSSGWSFETSTNPKTGLFTITAIKPFINFPQAQSIVNSIAGSKQSPVFSLKFMQGHSVLGTTTQADGSINLSCGLNCFGDSQLTQQFGDPLGFIPTQVPNMVFKLTLELPGSVRSSDGKTSGADFWEPSLGQKLQVKETAFYQDAFVAFVIPVLLLVMVAVVGSMVYRRGRSARRGSHRKQTVTPPS